ncbi:EFR1 family ferrodoxin [Salinispira pacifica]|uniref:Ferredoxin n=1 Tax=Salinispira pacifica TaxID=1307761 RepID=V5WLC4_9SPIO|nr:EFR1 family ferrodoxin [Salinispira pacifica]AHC16460.1 Ferredoxin [Salinispira pacifica]
MAPRTTELYYFTGTGNSLSIAKDLAAEIDGASIHSMSRHRGTIEADSIGLIFPIYFAQAPVFVQEFIDRADFGEIGYLFLIANGGGLFDGALNMAEDQLSRKGIKVNAGFTIRMPGNHPMISAIQTRAHEKFYRREALKVKRISRIISDRESRKVEGNFRLFGRGTFQRIFREPLQLSKAHRLDEVFSVNSSCNGCGICEQFCPVGNIQILKPEGRPTWNHHCVNCAGCYHHCPEEAIEFTGMRHQMKRYRHPDVTFHELIS